MHYLIFTCACVWDFFIALPASNVSLCSIMFPSTTVCIRQFAIENLQNVFLIVIQLYASSILTPIFFRVGGKYFFPNIPFSISSKIVFFKMCQVWLTDGSRFQSAIHQWLMLDEIKFLIENTFRNTNIVIVKHPHVFKYIYIRDQFRFVRLQLLSCLCKKSCLQYSFLTNQCS